MNYFTTDISNLSIFIQHSKSLGIDYWIFGRTLLYIFNTDTISNDKYDEIVIDVTPNALVIGSLIKRMLSSGFSLTNRKKFELLFTRHGRALIIKFLIINGMTSKIDGCFYKAKHFEGHDDMHIAESILNIPLLSKELLEDIFVPTINNKLRRVIYDLVLGRFKIKDYIMLFIRLLSPSKQMMALRYVYYFKNRSMPNSFFVIKKLSFNEFLDLNIDCSEFNWSFRSQHMNIISNGGKYKKIKDIVDYLKDNLVLQEVKSRIIDTPTNHRFNEPIYYSKSFWKTGNNFFIIPDS